MESHKRVVWIDVRFWFWWTLPEINFILNSLTDQSATLKPCSGEHNADLGERVEGSSGSLRVLWVLKKWRDPLEMEDQWIKPENFIFPPANEGEIHSGQRGSWLSGVMPGMSSLWSTIKKVAFCKLLPGQNQFWRVFWMSRFLCHWFVHFCH